MAVETLLDVLSRQIAVAEARLNELEGQRKRSEETASLLRSLRSTLKVFSSRGADLDDAEAVSFVLTVSDEGGVLLRWDRRLVPPSRFYLESILNEARLVLVPGQSLLLDSELARRLIEESLLETSASLRREEKRRSEILADLDQCDLMNRGRLLESLEDLEERMADLTVWKGELEDLRTAAAEWEEGNRMLDEGL